MSEQLTMNRVIHGAVRRDLERLDAALGTAGDGDRSRAQDLQRAYENLHHELTHHHEGEDRWIWPMLADAGVEADLLAAMESEHRAMHEALAECSARMTAYAASASATDAAIARRSVRQTQEIIEQHLRHEEQELEPALAQHLDSPEWKAVEKKLSRVPPAQAGMFFAWLTDGMSEQHRTFLRATVPAPVVLVLGRLFGRRYHREIAPVWRRTQSG